MERILVMATAVVIAVAAVVYIVKLLVLRIGGYETEAEVVAVKEIKQGTFVHRLRFEFNGKLVEKDDRTGYSQPFSKGDAVKIVCSKKNPDKFEYTAALKKNIIIACVLLIMSALIVLRFAFFVTE